MVVSISSRWTTDPEYNDFFNFLVEQTKNVKSPMNVKGMAIEFKEKSGAPQTEHCLHMRIERLRTHIHSFKHIDTDTKVKLLFALSASVDEGFLKKLKKDAVVEVDKKKRITHYESNDGSLELNGDHSQSAKQKTAHLGIESKRSLRPTIDNYFRSKNDPNSVPANVKEKEMWNLIEFITEKCENVKSPLSINRLAKDFIKKLGISQSLDCIYIRVKKYCCEVQKTDFLDTHSKVKQLFGLSATLDSDYLEKLRTEALVEIDEKNRIIHYKANDGSLELTGDHSFSAKNVTAMDESKLSHRSLIIDYFKNKNNADAVPKNEKEKELGNLIECITEKCEHVHSPLNILQLAKDFNQHSGVVRDATTIGYRIRVYRREIQNIDVLNTHSKVKQLFCLSAKLNSDYLKKLRKNAIVEVDDKNRITKYTANDNSLTLRGSHYGSGRPKQRCVEKTDKKNVAATADDSEEESENERFDDSSDEYSSEEFDSEFSSDDENDHLDETEDLIEPSNTVNDSNNKTPVRSRSGMSIDNSLDFDPPTEISYQSDGIITREDGEKENDPDITENGEIKTRSGRLSKRGYSNPGDDSDEYCPVSHTPKTSKRKAVPSESNASKRTKPPLEKSMDPLEMDDNTSYDDPSRIELEPFREPLGLSNKIEKDSDIQQILKPRPQVMEAPIKKEYEEEAQTSLKMVLNAFKSLVVSLDNPGLSQFQMGIDKKIMEAGRGIEVSNKEVILAMEFLIVKLSKHGSLESSEDSISLRDILLMLRTIILNSSFSGLDVILETLKGNIEQLKVLDERVPVSKVECVLRATLDIILT